MAAAVGSSTGKQGVVIHFGHFGCPPRRARPGSEKNKSLQREAQAHQSIHMSLARTNLSNEQPKNGRVIAYSGHTARRCGRPRNYQVHGPNACEKTKGGSP